MKVLVTGAAGFAGRHVVAALLRRGDEVAAADLDPAAASVPAGVQGVGLDVTDAQACWEVVHAARPAQVFHLAGLAHVGQAEQQPERCFEVNAGGTRQILEACLDGHANARVLVVSSAEVYGRVAPADLPVREDQPLRPGTAYAVSKACAEMHAHHAVSRGLHVVIARAFNHVGPGQSPEFVASAFARQIASIEAGLAEPVVRVGNLDAVRDLTDVADTAQGYLACLDAGAPGAVFNVTSGVAVPIRAILDTLRALARVDVRVELDPARVRALDVPVFHGDGGLLARSAGFRPGLDLRATLARVLDDWRGRLAAQAPR